MKITVSITSEIDGKAVTKTATAEFVEYVTALDISSEPDESDVAAHRTRALLESLKDKP